MSTPQADRAAIRARLVRARDYFSAASRYHNDRHEFQRSAEADGMYLNMVDALNEHAALLANVERLTKERDAARSVIDQMGLEFEAAMTGKPGPNGEYPHLLYCSASRRHAAGTQPGCMCLPQVRAERARADALAQQVETLTAALRAWKAAREEKMAAQHEANDDTLERLRNNLISRLAKSDRAFAEAEAHLLSLIPEKPACAKGPSNNDLP